MDLEVLHACASLEILSAWINGALNKPLIQKKLIERLNFDVCLKVAPYSFQQNAVDCTLVSIISCRYNVWT